MKWREIQHFNCPPRIWGDNCNRACQRAWL